MKTFAPAVLASTLTVLLAAAPRAGAATTQGESQRPRVDLVFAIDTTGSMGGLIQAAKSKVWSIINQIATGKPTPEVRVGLVAYRDRGDQYVTQVTDLTADLDAMYTRLMSFQADGGGDTPESVNQALADAVGKVSWSQGPQVMRLLFLVGDSPPHMDYQDDVKYPETARRAVRKGIAIHTIRCGGNPETERVWKDIARRAEGRYFSIDASGGAVAVATPYDGEIARIDGEVRKTALPYGGRDERERAKLKLDAVASTMAAAPAEAKAERAAWGARMAKAGPGAGGGSDADLVSGIASGAVDLSGISDDRLPDELRKLAPAARKARVDERIAERNALQAKLDDLSGKRAAYLAAQARKGGSKDSLGASVLEAVRERSAQIGVAY